MVVKIFLFILIVFVNFLIWISFVYQELAKDYQKEYDISHISMFFNVSRILKLFNYSDKMHDYFFDNVAWLLRTSECSFIKLFNSAPVNGLRLSVLKSIITFLPWIHCLCSENIRWWRQQLQTFKKEEHSSYQQSLYQQSELFASYLELQKRIINEVVSLPADIKEFVVFKYL